MVLFRIGFGLRMERKYDKETEADEDVPETVYNRMKRFLIRRWQLVYPAAEPNEEVPYKKMAVGLSSC